MKATALKPPEQSMNAEQNKDDRRHYSAKEAAALIGSTKKGIHTNGHLFPHFTGYFSNPKAQLESYLASSLNMS